MYGNSTLPGIAASDTLRYEGSIWRGATESTWFKIVNVSGDAQEATDIPAGSIMKEDSSTGFYSPVAVADLETLSGKLAIVADHTAKSGVTVDGESSPSKILIGVMGHVDKAKLFVGDTAFTDLTNAQQIALNSLLEANNFLLVNVLQG